MSTNMVDKNLEIDLLLDQRNTLISDIKDFNNNIIKIVIALIPILATLVASYFSTISSDSGFLIRYVVLEVIFILSMVISLCLFGANIKRDYIAAIDTYMFDTYGISVLICNGELSRKHTTGMKGVFPLMTLLMGFNAFCAIILLMIHVVKQDVIFYKDHVYLLVLFFIQMVVYLIIICINLKRKIYGKSIITEECLSYMKRNKEDEGEKVEVE